MTTRIPDLFQTSVVYAGFCFWLNSASDIAAAVGPIDIDCPIAVGGSKFRLSLTINPKPDKDGDIHLHLNLARNDILQSESLKDKGDAETALATIERFRGTKGALTVYADYIGSEDEINPDALINKLGEISASIGQAKIALTGAEFAVAGSPFKHVRWSKRNKQITGNVILAKDDAEITDDCLVDACKEVDAGIRRFLFEVID